ncbi:hypothetical protein GLOIN_2v1789848 [Rhizophagus irregularis DAOM 181602=DAOM 197198]|uniref:Uncharacterized protein n=1 Tax=Rhizophagus irregularis (strain DAOM 181602 / DAOM 197198 / MUCL 43194) TaxID=747089 RepID=A0A2P4P0D8_RHIID|nr:hypothetical protein GLOIN_2v1789848 [Rhizophagus irregularis DAOM 181602=DAOM 197198]POG58845.1 hypothetical protein GLOIN_2v1789848 [Rhizophagus irregularis DAOM 181602=DAOM 197198]|eukprot:XP_025165711.1 hypothetical protein GLOIN_2v1789848 [Rhizophagus irregularis DAOM 181602=DAOM 197198]
MFRTSDDIWWARIFDRLDEFLHNYPKLPKNSVPESSRLQDFFKVPNNDVVDGAPISVSGQILYYKPGGNGIEAAPDDVVRPDIAFVPRPAISAVISRPPIALGQSVGELKQKCLSWITMTAKLYRQGMPAQRWDFGNITKNSRVPVNDSPAIPSTANIIGTNFIIDLYRIQRIALEAQFEKAKSLRL